MGSAKRRVVVGSRREKGSSCPGRERKMLDQVVLARSFTLQIERERFGKGEREREREREEKGAYPL